MASDKKLFCLAIVAKVITSYLYIVKHKIKNNIYIHTVKHGKESYQQTAY